MKRSAWLFLSLVLSPMAIFASVDNDGRKSGVAYQGIPLASTSVVAPAPVAHYDEVFVLDRDPHGQPIAVVRPEYRDVIHAVHRIPETQTRLIDVFTRRDFDGENSLSILPRVLNSDEYERVLKRGVSQRGRALLAFLQDYYRTRGVPSITKNGVFPLEVLRQIVRRYGETHYLGLLRPETVSLFYGPDIIRAADGEFHVVEDTSGGYMGGFGDLKIAAESLETHVPGLSGLVEHDPMEFYRTLMDRYRIRAIPRTGKIVFLAEFTVTVREQGRLREIFEKLGAEFVSTNSASKIEFDKEGVWFRSDAGAPRERVGFVISYGEFGFLDPLSTATFQRSLYGLAVQAVERQRAKELSAGVNGSSRGDARIVPAFNEMMASADRVSGLPSIGALNRFLEIAGAWRPPPLQAGGFAGLSDAILKGKVASNITPGTEFISDKEFYVYVEKIIQHYLKEKPILRSIPTARSPFKLAQDGIVISDEQVDAGLLRDQKRLVIKRVDGRGGKDVYVGAKVSTETFAEGIAAMKKEPGHFLLQAYVPLSVVGREITDMRIFADVSPTGDAYVTDTPWGRALPIDGDGRVNITSKGHEMTVVVRSKLKFCSRLFGPLPASAVYRRP